uniref:Kinesin-like protein n=1 Tax=Rhizochromulina marina TaxID=1034831 RepID=A0A7S2S9V9_9STRA
MESIKFVAGEADVVLRDQLRTLDMTGAGDVDEVIERVVALREAIVAEVITKAADENGMMPAAARSKALIEQVEAQADTIQEQGERIDELAQLVEDHEATIADLESKEAALTQQVQDLEEYRDSLEVKYAEQRQITAKLILEVQALKGNIQVCCRIRPMSSNEVQVEGEPAVEFVTEQQVGLYREADMDWEHFSFDQVWGPKSTQADVFEQVEALALSVVDGYNATICAYGQTGSGKTFTMTGQPRRGQPGISFHALDRIFDMLRLKEKLAQKNRAAKERELAFKEARKAGRPPVRAVGGDSDVMEFEWSVELSMLEIYNEDVRCLLAPPPGKNEKPRKLDIKLAKDGVTTVVPGVITREVQGTEDALAAFELGSQNRATAATAMNATSSRSHMVMMVDVSTRTNHGPTVGGRLYLVDLAGSERVARSGAKGQTMKEAQGINKSLSALGDVMEALDRKSGHIPFRNSKLTYLLSNSLGGAARCLFIFNASPSTSNGDETRCTFKFASRMRNITLGAAGQNVDMGDVEAMVATARGETHAAQSEVARLTREVESLRRDMQSTSTKDRSEADKLAQTLELREGELRRSKKKAEDLSKAIQDQDEKIAQMKSQIVQLKKQGGGRPPPSPVVRGTPTRRPSATGNIPASMIPPPSPTSSVSRSEARDRANSSPATIADPAPLPLHVDDDPLFSPEEAKAQTGVDLSTSNFSEAPSSVRKKLSPSGGSTVRGRPTSRSGASPASASLAYDSKTGRPVSRRAGEERRRSRDDSDFQRRSATPSSASSRRFMSEEDTSAGGSTAGTPRSGSAARTRSSRLRSASVSASSPMSSRTGLQRARSARTLGLSSNSPSGAAASNSGGGSSASGRTKPGLKRSGSLKTLSSR